MLYFGKLDVYVSRLLTLFYFNFRSHSSLEAHVYFCCCE